MSLWGDTRYPPHCGHRALMMSPRKSCKARTPRSFSVKRLDQNRGHGSFSSAVGLMPASLGSSVPCVLASPTTDKSASAHPHCSINVSDANRAGALASWMEKQQLIQEAGSPYSVVPCVFIGSRARAPRSSPLLTSGFLAALRPPACGASAFLGGSFRRAL